MRKTRSTGGVCRCRWVTKYIHYLTGKVMIASEYGYKAWHFLSTRCEMHRSV